MNVMQVVTVRIKPGTEERWTKSTYDRVEEWLKHWTPRANFKAVLAKTREDALQKLQKLLQKTLVPSWLGSESGVNACDFQFEVSDQDATDGFFWMPSGCVWCHWHDIPAETGGVPCQQ